MNPYQKYQQQSVMTMTQGEMLIKLYDEVIKQLNAIKVLNDKKDYQGSNKASQKAQKIIAYLNSTLNFDYEISKNLSALYDYFNSCLVKTNLSKDSSLIDDILPMISDLRDSFAQADRSARTT